MKPLLTLGLLTVAMLTRTSTARAVDQDEIDKAIERGVKALRSMQQRDGTWRYDQIGATALAALTLLECGAREDDRDVLRAADAVRKSSLRLTHTYSLSLAILFLDRLGDPDDVPLIESLMVRLMAGQDRMSGGWSYSCPCISEAEQRRLQDKLNDRKTLVGRRAPGDAKKKRTIKDVSPQIREQLDTLWRGVPGPIGARDAPPALPPRFPPDRRPEIPPPAFPPGGAPPQVPPVDAPVFGRPTDNSNTQFAAFALWVGRRQGLPVGRSLTLLDRRFRGTQMPDGGWTYVSVALGPSAPIGVPGTLSTATMTCAGLISLAIADGATLEAIRERKPDARVPDINKDEHLMRGLRALGEVIDNPKGLRGGQPPPLPMGEHVGGRTYYFLWSMERVAVALNLDTLGKKDWYGWGAEILLKNQTPEGGWHGEYGTSGADTCFALLFLRRANLAKDLTAQIKGKLQDPGERLLVGGPAKRRPIRSGIETKGATPIDKPMKPADSESLKLAEGFLKARGAERGELLEQLRSGKGVQYTEALALAIPKLEGEMHRKAREALANRLTRMKNETLAGYLQDEDAEIRRAAALAVGQKESKTLLPNVISLLRDADLSVVRAAHASLKSLSGQDFGPSAKATREERDQAVLKWIEWWARQRRKPARE